MLKEYQKKILENINLSSEQKEAFEIMQPSMTTILDYQIKRLERTLSNKTDLRVHSLEIISAWQITLDHLKEARKLYS